MTAGNKDNVKRGQQSRNEPWKGPGVFDDGTPRTAPNVLEQEKAKKEAQERKGKD